MKLFVLKKSVLIITAAIILAGTVIGICAGAAVKASSSHDGGKTIVIDAGHGGIDAGVRGINTSTKESDINLSISKYLRGYFVDAGFNVVMTRTKQGGLYGTSSKGFKMRDMVKRKETIEKSNADMVISIHQNFCPVPSKRGGTVFFNPESQCGKSLAQHIQNSINDMKGNAAQNSILSGDYYMLKCTQSPSVIVECGFLSNPEDEALLITDEYRKSIAYAIFKGAVSYYS